MLRRACGYAPVNAGHDARLIQDWLGHRSIQHTTRYTQLSATPFKDFWTKQPGRCWRGRGKVSESSELTVVIRSRLKTRFAGPGVKTKNSRISAIRS
jgi:hypothetical protein